MREPDSSPCEVFPADPAFPQLKTASDPGLMLEIFRAHLKSISGSPYHIRECIPFRFRLHQKSARCVLQYTLRLVEPRSGREQNQWVTGFLHAEEGESERHWRELQAADPRQGIPEHLLTFEPVGFIPELKMLTTLFPYDRKLPSLLRVMAGPWGDLKPQLLARFGPGDWNMEQCNIEAARYRAELGAVVRYTVSVRDGLRSVNESRRFYLKVYKEQGGEETFQLLRALSESTGHRGFSVVRPVTYDHQLNTLVMEEAPGVSLQEVFLRGCDPVAASVKVARAVAALNQSDIGATRPYSLESKRSQLERAATLLRWACPELRPALDQVTAAVIAGLEEAPAAPIHRDLKPDHIFLDGDRVTFVDLDSLALADPVVDPAHLMSHLVARVGLPSVTFEQARAAAAAFAEEYFAHVPAAWRRRLPAHYAAALLEVAAGIFRGQEAQWRGQVGAAVEEARSAFSGGFV